ncbi:MAG: hypothetical protein U1E25_08055 [Methylocystis sp.]
MRLSLRERLFERAFLAICMRASIVVVTTMSWSIAPTVSSSMSMT